MAATRRGARVSLGTWVAMAVTASVGMAQATPGRPASPAHTETGPAAAALKAAVSAAERGDVSRAMSLTQALIAAHPEYAPAYKFEGFLDENAGKLD